MKSLRTLQLASAVLFLLFLAPLANAQLAVYGTVMLTNYGYSHSSNGFLYYNDTGGLGAGATYLFESQSRLKAGLDFRVAGSPGA
jgi:long-subunit fatty acid transport protein